MRFKRSKILVSVLVNNDLVQKKINFKIYIKYFIISNQSMINFLLDL